VTVACVVQVAAVWGKLGEYSQTVSGKIQKFDGREKYCY
jgi:hypothetical protein